MKALNEPPPYKSYPPLTPKLARPSCILGRLDYSQISKVRCTCTVRRRGRGAKTHVAVMVVYVLQRALVVRVGRRPTGVIRRREDSIVLPALHPYYATVSPPSVSVHSQI